MGDQHFHCMGKGPSNLVLYGIPVTWKGPSYQVLLHCVLYRSQRVVLHTRFYFTAWYTGHGTGPSYQVLLHCVVYRSQGEVLHTRFYFTAWYAGHMERSFIPGFTALCGIPVTGRGVSYQVLYRSQKRSSTPRVIALRGMPVTWRGPSYQFYTSHRRGPSHQVL